MLRGHVNWMNSRSMCLCQMPQGSVHKLINMGKQSKLIHHTILIVLIPSDASVWHATMHMEAAVIPHQPQPQ